MKRILICLDGTWNKPNSTSSSATNVQKIHEKFIASEDQVSLYLKGVGTNWFDKISGGAFGFGLFDQIKSAYQQLTKIYDTGDEIFIVGFSRGAFSARCLAGFIATCGILKERRSFFDKLFSRIPSRFKISLDGRFNFLEHRDVNHLWELYKNRENDSESLEGFIQENCHLPNQGIVQAVAVWDTVGALGIPWDIFPAITKNLLSDIQKRHLEFLDTELHPFVLKGYHALALDEQRKVFSPTLWTGDRIDQGDIDQVWFAGVHSNIGGGFSNTGLSDITLDWVMGKLSQNHGLQFEAFEFDKEKIWEDVGETKFDNVLIQIDNPLLNTIQSRDIPENSILHSTAILRSQGDENHAPIKSVANFLGNVRQEN